MFNIPMTLVDLLNRIEAELTKHRQMEEHHPNIWVCLKMLAKPRKTQWFC